MFDNALSSASNFLSVIVALRVSAADGFAAAGIALILVRIVIAISRSYSVEPVVTRDPTVTTVTSKDLRSVVVPAATSGAALATASVVFLVVTGVTLTLGLILVTTVGLVCLCIGEAIRSLYLLRRRYRWPLWYDGSWLIMFCALIPIMLRWNDPGSVLAAWSLTGVSAAILTLPALRAGIDAGSSVSSPRRLTIGSRVGIASETAIDRMSNQFSVAIIAAAAAATTATGLTAARTVLSPLNTVLFALFNFLLPVAATASPQRRAQIVRTITLVAPTVVLLVSIVVVLMPTAWLRAVIGPPWENARSVFVPIALLFSSAIMRQLILAVARGSAMFTEARRRRYVASALTFAPCLLPLLNANYALPALYIVTATSLAGAVLVSHGVYMHLTTSRT